MTNLIHPELMRLMSAFPNSFINHIGEFIADRNSNQYFRLEDCYNELDLKRKTLEWLSRAAYKSEPYSTKKENDELHKYMMNGINKYLGTSFTAEDMMVIYTYLGNECNRHKTYLFIQSNYDMRILTDDEYRERFEQERERETRREMQRILSGTWRCRNDD